MRAWLVVTARVIEERAWHITLNDRICQHGCYRTWLVPSMSNRVVTPPLPQISHVQIVSGGSIVSLGVCDGCRLHMVEPLSNSKSPDKRSKKGYWYYCPHKFFVLFSWHVQCWLDFLKHQYCEKGVWFALGWVTCAPSSTWSQLGPHLQLAVWNSRAGPETL